jgi:protein-tyrosine phosphatase
MIDLHCHFLPGIDDGPETMAEALDLARMAVGDGITHSVLTSHVHPERWPNTSHNLKHAVKEFSAALAAANIPLEVSMGGEARLCPELIDLVAENQAPFLGTVDSFKVLLLEFPHALIPVGADRLVTALLRRNIRPLIAHPERNKAVMAHPEKIQPFVDLGCWLQLTAGSLAGRFGDQVQTTAWALLESDAWCVMATDAHNLQHRPPLLSEGRRAVAGRLGQAMADQLVIDRPQQILGLAVAPAIASSAQQ